MADDIIEVGETEWKTQVIDLAHTFGWTVAHFRPAKTSKGWRTPVEADGAGFPDLLMARDRVIVAELKAKNGKTTEAQEVWLGLFRVAGIAAYVWRPADVREVTETLSGVKVKVLA